MQEIEFRIPLAQHHSGPAKSHSLACYAGALAREGGEVNQATLHPDDIVRLDFSDGSSRWVEAAELQSEGVKDRGQESGVVDLALLGASSRGPGSTVVRAVELFRLPPEQAALDLCSDLENRAITRKGLLELESFCGSGFFEAARDPRRGEADRAQLLLIHGTGSSIPGGFVGLAQEGRQQRWNQLLQERYQGRAWVFNHKTLTESPLQNALELLQALPQGARLHVVSHSRGGLVGELLALDPQQVGPQEESIFRDRPQELELLQAFVRLRREKGVQVERFVRVACPAQGTTLASGRLDLYLQTLANLLQWAATKAVGALADSLLPGSSALSDPLVGASWDHLEQVILAVIKTRTRPEVLPGLEAMLPSSPLIRFLNQPHLNTQAQLLVIAGDVQKPPHWKERLLKAAADLFYLENHDYVVDTRSMLGGLPGGQRRYFQTSGPESNHLRYFKNQDSFQALCEALEGNLNKFLPIEPPRPATGLKHWVNQVLGREASTAPKPVLVLLPGAMGSLLSGQDGPIWLDPGRIARGKFTELDLTRSQPPRPISAEDALGRWYGELGEALSASHQVVVFPYDWRLSPLLEGQRLARQLSRILQETGPDQPIRFLCHSLGGLVLRAMWALSDGPASALRQRPGGRTLMLGVPNVGSFAAAQMLLGKGGTFNIINVLAALDLVNRKADILATAHSFDGLLQLLPPQVEEVWQKSYWDSLFEKLSQEPEQLTLPPLSEARLAGIRHNWQALADCHSLPGLVYVAGLGQGTPCGILPDQKDWFGRRRLALATTPEGDGTVPWKDCVPAGVPLYYAAADHGNLPRHSVAFRAYQELLQQGATSHPALSRRPPLSAQSRDLASRVDFSDQAPLFPGLLELEAAAVGAQSLVVSRQSETGQLKVQVVHGDLRYARHPVVLGHYANQPLEGTQKALDSSLDGRLRMDKSLGLYPGPLGSVGLYLTAPSESTSFPGGIILGLGDFGQLSPADLVRASRKASLEYARWCQQNQRPEVALSYLLIGSMEGGLTLEESVNCLVSGVLEANQVLQAQGSLYPSIRSLELLELWEDRAIEAAHCLTALAHNPRWRGQLDFQPEIREVSGHRRRVSRLVNQTDWHRLQIRESPRRPGQLTFNLLTRRARSEVSRLQLENQLIEGFLAQACSQIHWQADLSQTLFELLIPNRLKQMADDQRHLILLLDESSARFPWELLRDGRDQPEAKPASIRSCLIRQLASVYFRENPLANQLQTALVVGDPPSHLEPLPGAQAEAKVVSERLQEANFAVESLIQQSGERVVRALFARDVRVLHLSGHGLWEKKGREVRAGMVLGPNELLLTPATLAQLNLCPELVFINCCHLGRIEATPPPARYPELAANLASEMIRAGARAVVAAGWAVEDQSARLFADSFYREMLRGQRFGPAVRTAREEVYERYPQFNTWGAYQCYGDPDFQLVSPQGDSSSSSGHSYASKAERVAELENLTQEVELSSLSEYPALLQRLKQLEATAPLEDERVLLALARCSDQLIHPLFGMELSGRGRSQDPALLDSLKYYESLSQKSSNLSLNDVAIYQRLQLLQHFQEPPVPCRSLKDLLQDRKDLLALGATAKAHSRVGGLAMTALLLPQKEGDPSREKLLEEMERSYSQARELAEAKDGQFNYYQDYHFLARLARGGSPNFEELPALAPGAPDKFFSALNRPRRQLLGWVASRCDQEPQKLLQDFADLRQRGFSPFQFKAVLELFEFLLSQLQLEPAGKDRLQRLYSDLLDTLGL